MVGASGAGKSTVFHLLQHFYEASRGAVLLDGHDVADLDHSWLHANIGMVGQEPVLFSGTIEYNIGYGSTAPLTRQQVEAAARVANAHEFIASLPDGYQTAVGERGLSLSGNAA